MHQLLSTDILLCEGFRLDRLGLSRLDPGGVASPVALGSRALDLAWLLADRHGELISKDEIMETVWPGRVVEENNLTVQISALRRIFDQARPQGSCIQTVVGHGYRFVGSVTRAGENARPALPAAPDIPAPSVPRLSIVVLPFANLGAKPNQQYFADGITDDLITDLSRISLMFVISRNTAFTYKNKSLSTKQIGRELGVRYVLEGSVRRSGARVRVNAQLVDAETDGHLWADRYDCHLGELFAVQDDITSRIAASLNLELVAVEAARPVERPDALDYVLRGRAAIRLPPSRENYAAAIRLFERALVLDPRSVEAQSALGAALAARVLDQMADRAEANIPYAERLIDDALTAAPRSALAHFAKGAVLRVHSRPAEAIQEYEMANVLHRNWEMALSQLGWSKLWAGSVADAIPLQQQAIRLGPRDPSVGSYFLGIGVVQLLQARIDEAIHWFEKARSANPTLPQVRTHLASAYALRGEAKAASAELDAASKLRDPSFYSSIARLKSAAYFGVPRVHALYDATFFAGLRRAGMPEE